MTRWRPAVVTAALTLTVGLVALDRAEAQPWTISEQGVVTRQDLHPNGAPPNPLRHVPDELLVKLRSGLSPAAAARALASVPWRSTKRFHAVEHLYHVKLAPGSNLHQAMFELPAEGQPTGTVLQVLQPGYVLHDRLIRPAMVAVAKAELGDSAAAATK